jgi:hypothetical protein
MLDDHRDFIAYWPIGNFKRKLASEIFSLG